MEQLTLRPGGVDDLPLLHRSNAPAMTSHLNGPETEAQLDERHARYLRLNATGEAHVCRRAGFALVGSSTEAFRGAPLMVNEWAYDLRAHPRGNA